ncbi:MAG: hypothetical protein A2623_10475 [Caulobacterales bacterium RIFCSPHIGHO2_01_FULL_70_19]|nr:MAG: hypothetical protein A2623_10475 [Caulobacterales bacterium RIFCSPHIGHO2_01_FULL_70_19]
MADVQSLSQFTLSETPDGYLIEIEGDGGGSIAVEATPEQLDAIIDALDDLLSEDEAAADEVGDGPDEEEDEDRHVDDVVHDDES